jgi:hypothetical protein
VPSLDNVIIFNAMLNLTSWVDPVHHLLAWLQWHLRSDHGEKETIHKYRESCFCKNASLPGCSITSVAHGEGLPQSTVQGFLKNIKKLEEKSMTENNLKATHKDRTPTITKALITSCSNYS